MMDNISKIPSKIQIFSGIIVCSPYHCVKWLIDVVVSYLSYAGFQSQGQLVSIVAKFNLFYILKYDDHYSNC